MKTFLLVGLIVELTVGGLLLLGLLSPVSEAQSDSATDNATSPLVEFLPDIGKIYRAALTAPLQEVEQEIEDEEIARFYHRLIERYDLD